MNANISITSNGYFDDTLTLQQCTDDLRQLLGEFPFSEKKPASDLDGASLDFFQSRSMAVQIAAMVSQAHPGLLPAHAPRPGFIYNANSERSGKTLLCKIAIIPFYGEMAVLTWIQNEQEMVKRIDALMMGGARYVVLDNVRGHIQSQAIEALVTCSTWTGRVLSRSEMFRVPNQTTLFLTGNDCTVNPDISHRFLVCDLFVEEANVQDRRVVDPIGDNWLMQSENRRKILSALFGLVRYWNAAGRPKSSGRVRLGFEQWCNIYAGIVEFAGFGDCLAEPEMEKDLNTEAADIRALVRGLLQRGEVGVRRFEVSFQQIINAAHEAGLCSWVLDGKEEQGDFILTHKSGVRFGRWFRKYAPLKPNARKFRITESDVVRMHCTSNHQNRRYIIERA